MAGAFVAVTGSLRNMITAVMAATPKPSLTTTGKRQERRAWITPRRVRLRNHQRDGYGSARGDLFNRRTDGRSGAETSLLPMGVEARRPDARSTEEHALWTSALTASRCLSSGTSMMIKSAHTPSRSVDAACEAQGTDAASALVEHRGSATLAPQSRWPARLTRCRSCCRFRHDAKNGQKAIQARD
jgi:hypothetical protein